MPVGVYRRKGSPYYWFNIPPSLSPTGKRVRASTKRLKKREAELFAEQERARLLDQKQTYGRPALSLRAAIFDHYLPARVRAASYRNLKHYAAKLVGDVDGIAGVAPDALPFHEITGTMLRKYREQREAQGASPQTIDHEIKVVSGAYHMLEADFQVRPGLKFPMARPKGKPRPLTPDEESRLLEELHPARPIVGSSRVGTYLVDRASNEFALRQANHDLVVVLLDTGCRLSEITRLTWDQIDTRGWMWLHIYRTKVGNEGRLAMTNRVREIMQRRHSAKQDDDLYIFGAHWKAGPKTSTVAIRKAMAKVGINDAHNVQRYGTRDVRSLRDTFATKLRLKGMSLDRLQKLLGHASSEMTAKYGDLPVDIASREAVAILDNTGPDRPQFIDALGEVRGVHGERG